MQIINLHYGWDKVNYITLQEIGELFNITKEGTRRLENQACTNLRHSKWARNKAKELYGQKKKEAVYSIPDIVDNIGFTEWYLWNEVI